MHARVRRSSLGDLHISWIRRSRVEGDEWTQGDVPLDETEERYRLEILSGSAVVRTVEVGEAAATYPATDELADFGSAQAVLALRVCQLGRLGAGPPLQAVVAIE